MLSISRMKIPVRQAAVRAVQKAAATAVPRGAARAAQKAAARAVPRRVPAVRASTRTGRKSLIHSRI